MDELDTGFRSLVDLNLNSDGTLLASNWFGDVVLTDTAFSTVSSFSVGSGLTYSGFVTAAAAVPEPPMLMIFMFGLLLISWHRMNMGNTNKRMVRR